MDELGVRDWILIGTQIVFISTVVISNKNHITHIKQQNEDLKAWLQKVQETVNDLRVKVGI